jgi:hypothetical protein
MIVAEDNSKRSMHEWNLIKDVDIKKIINNQFTMAKAGKRRY